MNLWEEKIAPEGKGKEKSARLTYHGGTIDVYDEAGSSDIFFKYVFICNVVGVFKGVSKVTNTPLHTI
jgi:hypothetical protein